MMINDPLEIWHNAFFSGLLRLLLQFSEIALLQVDVSSSTSRQWFVELTIGLVGRNVEKVQT